MSGRQPWTRQQLLVACYLYCQLPFGKLHSRNPDIIKFSQLIGRTPSALAMKLTNLASLDPIILSSGRKGLQGASAADRAIWQEMVTNWEGFVVESHEAVRSLGMREAVEDSVELESVDYSGQERVVQSKTRVGQNFFRKAVLSAYGYKCCITGLAQPRLLIASHIVPWRDDKNNRLNPHNGLALSMLHDKAFDIGMITVSEEMTVQVTKRDLTAKDEFFEQSLMAFHGKPIYLPEKFEPHAEFLAYHREHVFERWSKR